MFRHDYSKELGLETGEKIVPLSVALPLLAVVATGSWVGVAAMPPQPKHERPPEQTSATIHVPGRVLARR